MSAPTTDPTERSLRYILFILGIALIILLIFLVAQYRQLRRDQILNAREMWLSAVLKRHGPPVPADASVIRSWMTFDYIDKTFGLPESYLQNQLQISDPRYPKLTLSSYIQEEHLDATAFTGEVVAAVQMYLTLANPAVGSASSTDSRVASPTGTLPGSPSQGPAKIRQA